MYSCYLKQSHFQNFCPCCLFCNPLLLCNISEGFYKEYLSLALVPFISLQWDPLSFDLFLSDNNCFNLFTIAWMVSLCEILTSPNLCQNLLSFLQSHSHIGIIYKHSLFECISHTGHCSLKLCDGDRLLSLLRHQVQQQELSTMWLRRYEYTSP